MLTVMPRASVNQKLIAAQLNLSTATVSKSFRNHPDIKPETRALVLEYAARLGYVASLSPRSGSRVGKSRQAKFIGVLFNSNTGPAAADYAGAGYLTGLSEAAGMHDASLIVHRFTGSSERVLDPAFQPVAMRDGSLDGVILIHQFDSRVMSTLAARYPAVTLTHFVHGVRMDLVDSNHSGAMAKLTDHLLDLGHRKIGFIGRAVELSYSQARFGSFAQTMARLGMPIDPDLTANVFSNTPDFDVLTDWAVKRIKQGTTAWVCATDHVGYEIIHRLAARGLKVPDDVSFTGYDSIEPMFGLPQITTMRVPFVEMGALSVERLVQRIGRPSQPYLQSLIDCQFVLGQTTGRVTERSAELS